MTCARMAMGAMGTGIMLMNGHSVMVLPALFLPALLLHIRGAMRVVYPRRLRYLGSGTAGQHMDAHGHGQGRGAL